MIGTAERLLALFHQLSSLYVERLYKSQVQAVILSEQPLTRSLANSVANVDITTIHISLIKQG